jgi:hypothetical protein
MIASAWQKTGIDAIGDLSFNTRSPNFSLTPPGVGPLTVGLRPKQDERVMGVLDIAPPMPMAGMNETAPAASAMGYSTEPEAISTLAGITLKAAGRVKGDGTSVSIPLGEFGMESVPELISIPERNREAWIVASIDTVPETLMQGMAELSVDGASTGQTHISNSFDGMRRIPFGMVARLTSKKSPFVGRSASSWTGTGTLDDGYTIEITSGLDIEREITVLDRIPIPTIDKVALDVKSIDPEPAERDKENRLTWKIRIKPGETKRITVEYTLKYPRDETLEFR